MIELNVASSNAPALVDDCWAHLMRYRWRLDKDGYVMRKAKGKRIYLHQVILPGRRYPDFVRDHINRDKLDNREENLRWITLAENAQNRGASKCNKTGYRGVLKVGRRYRAVAYLHKRPYCFGTFDTPEQANAVVASWRAANMPMAGD